MTNPCMDRALTERLQIATARHGWFGRLFGAQRWISAGAAEEMPLNSLDISVIAICRGVSGTSLWNGFAPLRGEGIPFESIEVDITNSEISVEGCTRGDVSVHILLPHDAPWYTAFNLGALCATGELLVFLDGTTHPQPGLLAAYQEIFKKHPETKMARGAMYVSDLYNCVCQSPGSFSLPEETEYWPVDLDENMAARADTFFDLGGFDESMIGGYGALDLSIRLFGRSPSFRCQRYVSAAKTAMPTAAPSDLSMTNYLLQRQRSWLQLNDSLKRYLDLYGKFWQEKGREGKSLD